MGKKIFGIYLAKLDAPNSEAHARLELPASPLELHDAMDKVQLQENEELYLEIDDYYGFEYLAPHLMELDASLNELNDLAGRLAVLDETEQEAFDGLLRLEIQRKVESNGSILTMQDLRTLAVSAGADCCHVVGATSDAELGRFYAENGFMEELDGLSDDVFEMLDFGKIGKALRTGENGTFTRNGYVVQYSELVTAPPCAKELPEKPEYLFRLTLGLHPDLEDDRTVTLELAQLEKNYGKEGSEIIQDNCQDTIFGGFAPNSQTAEVLSKALGNRTVLSGSVSRGKNDPSQSLQMMERPLLTADELKAIPKGNFIVQKTGQHPMRTRLRLFLEWGITFEEPYIVPERADRAVAYANREDLERNLPQSNKAENADMRGAYAVSGRGGIAHEPAVDKPRRRGGKQMKTYGEEDL